MNNREIAEVKVFVSNETYNEYKGTLQEQINNLQSKIDKVNEIIKDWHQEYNGLMETNNIYIPKDKPSLFDLRDILKENNNEKII